PAKERLESVLIELRDIDRDLAAIPSSLQIDPQRLEVLSARLDLLNGLMHKHRVGSVEDLLATQKAIGATLNNLSTIDREIEDLALQKAQLQERLEKEATLLSDARSRVIPLIESEIEERLHTLGMPDARFRIALHEENGFSETGHNRALFLFSAHTDLELQPLTKIASGGELSRIMLSIKAAIANTLALPTLIFDEIDSGVSGEIADKMGKILALMSAGTQMINITHLPQVAAKGSAHYHVYKEAGSKLGTQTRIRQLSPPERIEEIARMLSGETVTPAALENARHLLGLNKG
ncbi:MAG: DNA repair protein RecN, partial [Bacteroidales bacterium]